MSKLTVICLALGLGLAPYAQAAATFDGSVPLICAPIEAMDCEPGADCQRGAPESVNLPQFIKLNFTEKTLSTTEAAQKQQSTAIKNYEVPPRAGTDRHLQSAYYEDVLVVKVHPELLTSQKLPPGQRDKAFWEARYEDINAFERHLVRNSTLVLKFFLNVSKQEQKYRLLERLENAEKHWKFSASDLAERAFWDPPHSGTWPRGRRAGTAHG